ncbi:hypothetical protein Clacol_008562 [Clathrus columnatus]|uniref:Macrofage activating glycoprotein n=1 Tax=Clathrus columnatus TaxID=1419009 RepID=A0AAV5ALF3_9AGAM|nr:hypothetical protein Clacol_008562 [Clathrus columnatus]
MTFSMRSLIALGILAGNAALVESLTPLASKSFPFTALPTQASGNDAGPRGPQSGFNNCNNSTASDTSMCQTLVFNSMTDFCVWGTPKPDETIADTEAAEVAYCTSSQRGGRPIRPGSIFGAQWLYAKDYIQLSAFIDQAAFGLAPDDQGGELDPHGADQQGNPLGGIAFSNSFTKGFNAAKFNEQLTSGVLITSDQEEQLQEWVEFIGNGLVCVKMCTNTDPDRGLLCNHIYDEIGCAYNAVADYSQINGTFTVCDSDDMAFPGIFTQSDGVVTTWTQPFSGTFSVPYVPTQVASSNCFTYESTQLFPNLAATPTTTAGSHPATATGENPGSTGSNAGSAGGPAPTSGPDSSAAVGVIAGPFTVIVGAMLGAFITIFA